MLREYPLKFESGLTEICNVEVMVAAGGYVDVRKWKWNGGSTYLHSLQLLDYSSLLNIVRCRRCVQVYIYLSYESYRYPCSL